MFQSTHRASEKEDRIFPPLAASRRRPSRPIVACDVIADRATFDPRPCGGTRMEAIAPQSKPTAHPDWGRILALATRHRVRPLLYASLRTEADVQANEQGAFAASDSKAAIQSLREFVAANMQRNLFLLRELFNLLDLFQSQSIPAAAFKGPMLAWNAYGSGGLREAGDLDLLVRKRDIRRARQLLFGRGFVPAFPTATPREIDWLQSLTGEREASYLQRHSEHHLLDRQGLVNVDLHWALTLRDFWILPDAGKVWNWLVPQKLAGRTVLGFPDEQTLLILCINGAKDCWERLDRICDVAQWIISHPRLDWQKVLKLARGAGALRMVCLGLALAENLLGIQLPDQGRSEIQSHRIIPGLLEQIRRRLFAPAPTAAETASFPRTQLHLLMRERLQDRIGYCLAHLEPTVGDWAALPLPQRLSFLHYLTRPLRLLARYRADEPDLAPSPGVP